MTPLAKVYAFSTLSFIEFEAKSKSDFQELVNCISQVDLFMEEDENKVKMNHIDDESNFEGLDALELIESRGVIAENHLHSMRSKNDKKRKIKEIEEERKKIIEELREIDDEICEIKGNGKNENVDRKRDKIQRDESALKNAEILVKELKNQRKEIEARKKSETEKSLLEMKREDEERKRKREEESLRIKEERREAILERMEDEKKRREERKLIEMQSNKLIAKLKKEEELEKIATMVPTKIVDTEIKSKIYDRKNNFDFREIEEHDRKYRELKKQKDQEKESRAQSLKNPKAEKYSKNVWIEKIEQEQEVIKEEQRKVEERKKNQLEKRMKYGDLVKNIFFPKKKEHDASSAITKEEKRISHHDEDVSQTEEKPKTPQEFSSLPKIKTEAKSNKTHNSRMFNEDSLPHIKNAQKVLIRKKEEQKIPDFDLEETEKNRKIREFELRKQTKERLKKLENQQKAPQTIPEKKVYKNYLTEVKVKKDEQNDWKKIMNNERLTEEQKYEELVRKAENLEMRAKKKEDKNKEADDDAVNLYIGSIQAKLALLEKF